MEKLNMLSGQQLLEQIITKQEATLPLPGSKYVTLDDSLNQKEETHRALESRKQIIEAQRIEKCGSISHAKWQESLKLAEVIEKCGGHWQYFGHSKDRKIYLKPAETLYLMEINCLLLTYDDIVVSLQQAYTLLLSDYVSIYKYKVYASLSRLGYKVFEHVYNDTKENSKSQVNDQNVSHKVVDLKDNTENCNNMLLSDTSPYKHNDHSNKEDHNSIESNVDKNGNTSQSMESIIIDGDNDITTPVNGKQIFELQSQEISNQDSNVYKNEGNLDSSSHFSLSNVPEISDKDPLTIYNEQKLKKLKERILKSRSYIDLQTNWDDIPEILGNRTVLIKMPDREYLPDNIFFNKATYLLNIENIKSKNKPQPFNTSAYSMSDEANGDHMRRVTNAEASYRPQNVVPQCYQNIRQSVPYRQFIHWRPRPTLNYVQFNMFFQRNFMPHFNTPRFHFFPRTHMSMFPRVFNSCPPHIDRGLVYENRARNEITRKRKRNFTKKNHLDSIKHLVSRLRRLSLPADKQAQNIESLKKLIQTYNLRYNTKLRLTEQLEIINEENIIETIVLDDEEESEIGNKKRRIDNTEGLQTTHLNRIRDIAESLKLLQDEKKSSARHRRAFSALIRTYNKTYNTEIYVNSDNEILDKMPQVKPCSSQSNPVKSDLAQQKSSKLKSGKKLRNPFNILRRLSEKNKATVSTVIQDNKVEEQANSKSGIESTIAGFSKLWLPDADDFGRPETVGKDNMTVRIAESKADEYLFEFLGNKLNTFNNWVETKIAFLENLEETKALIKSQAMNVDHVEIKSIVKSEHCTDMATVLKKLSIIKTNKNNCSDCLLNVDFDVYNRDVSNFSKTNRSTPHFRIVCLDASKPCPTGSEIAALHSKYTDDVMMVFAITSMESISYIELNPTELSIF